MQALSEDARELVNIESPAEDPGSLSFTAVARQANQIGADHVKEEWQQARDLAEKLGKALDVYKETDEQAAADTKNAGGEGGGLL